MWRHHLEYGTVWPVYDHLMAEGCSWLQHVFADVVQVLTKEQEVD